jgi:hypothetical protein
MNFRSTGEGGGPVALGLYDSTSKFTSRVAGMTRVLGSSRVWGKGYTTVPVLVRRLLDLSEGSEIEWVLNDDGSIGVRKIG